MSNTKNFCQLIEEFEIVIPLIQRDYAQGRKNEEYKAIKFLEAIKNGLISGLNLDFIYGNKNDEKKIFFPLDGQQRLTTLFLLYFYCQLDNSADSLYLSTLRKFKYEIRSTTKDFIIALTTEENIVNLKKHGTKEQIENSNWFFKSWLKDPTVSAILNMIKLIDDNFKNIDLNVTNLSNITFEVLFLNEYKLTEELYVKMNARGKPLTLFENFKAKFLKYVSSAYPEKETEIYSKFDNEWLSFFWKKTFPHSSKVNNPPKIADMMFYNFIYNTSLNLLIETHHNTKNKIIISTNENEFSSINNFIEKLTIFDFYEDVYGSDNKTNDLNIKILINILNRLALLENTLCNVVLDIIIQKKQLLSDEYSSINDISLPDRVKWYAICLGLNHLENSGENCHKIKFEDWIRVTFNLVNNQLIQSNEDFIKSVHSLRTFMNNLLKLNKSIYESISDDFSFIEYFNNEQRKEEARKATLILKNNNWENEIILAEKNWYLQGIIGFLLDYAKDDLEQFKIYRDKFLNLWCFAKGNKDAQILIYQALLTKGWYLPKLGSNHTFCSFDASSFRVRYDNWRKVFINNDLSRYLQELLDDPNFTIDDINKSLNFIIHEYINNSEVDDFRDLLISNNKYIEYCKSLQLRIYDQKIYLLKKSQMNGQHVELHTWDFFNTELGKDKESEKRILPWRNEKQVVFNPFLVTYYYVSSSTEEPAIVLSDFNFNENKIELCITFKSDKYIICFWNANDNYKAPIPETIKQSLSLIDFIDNKYEISNRNQIIPKIEEVCNVLNSLVN